MSKLKQDQKKESRELFNSNATQEEVREQNHGEGFFITRESFLENSRKRVRHDDDPQNEWIPVVEEGRIAKAPEPEEDLSEPEYVGVEQKFTQVQADDSKRMVKVREALGRYYEAQTKEETDEAINGILKACDDYAFMRWSWTRGARGKKRLKEVQQVWEHFRTIQLREHMDDVVGDAEGADQQMLWRLNSRDYNALANEVRNELRNENKEKKVDREALRSKKTYKLHKLNDKQQDNNTRYILGSQQIKSIRSALLEVMPDSYKEIDKGLTDKEAEELELELVHAQGSKFLDMGHDVIEFDVAGSGFDQFRKEHDGVHGINADDRGGAGMIYDEKLQGDGYLWRTKTQKVVGEGEKQRTATKTRYSIAGPAALNADGISDWSIQKTRARIRDMGAVHLKPVFDSWREAEKRGEVPKFHTIDLMFRGHSRGGVGASQGAMMLKYWVQENYPEYMSHVSFHLTQYDPVPGGDVEFSKRDGMERFDVKEYQGVNKGSFTIQGEKMAPLGEESGTTVIYSMVNQADATHENLFSPQEVLHAKRLILMPFTHDIGLDLTHIDTSQKKDDQNEKAHAMAFINATDKKVYRSSGLNELAEGVYIMDENHVMVKVDSFAQLYNILMRTMPDTYVKRRSRILSAAASIFGDRMKMDEYASIDHERSRMLARAIEKDGNASKYRQAVKDNLKALRKALKERPTPEAQEGIMDAYDAAIESCSVYIAKRDKDKWTTVGRNRVEHIKLMYSTLVREKRHLQQKLKETNDPGAYASFDELFHTTSIISRESCDVREMNDSTMEKAYRIEHSGSVAFFAEKEEAEAESAAVISRMAEHIGLQGYYRGAVQATIQGDGEHAEKKGILYEQTYDLSYTQVMSKDFEYSRYKKPEMIKDAQIKLQRILALDLLFGITDRLSGDLSTLRVAVQRHQAEDTKEKAKGGSITNLKDTYSIIDVCADLIMSPLFKGQLKGELTEFELTAIRSFASESKDILKKMTPADLREMAGGSLSSAQLEVLAARLKAIKARL